MDKNFTAAAAFTSAEEGGYQSARSDDGNWTGGSVGSGRLVGTMRGISAPAMAQFMGGSDFVTPAVMKGIGQDTFEAIARSMYWRALNCDNLPSGVDLMLFDFGFNSGTARAARQLQQVVGVPAQEIDGDIGPDTLSYLSECQAAALLALLPRPAIEDLQQELGLATDGVIGPKTRVAFVREYAGQSRDVALIHILAARQEAAYRSFRSFGTYGNGWLARLRRRKARALELAFPVLA